MSKFLILFFLVSNLQVSAQTPNEILATELNDFIEAHMAVQDIPGLSASIVKKGKVVWEAAFGTANFDTQSPVTLQTEFTLASISKLFTATACAQLWENGTIDLDENINTYLPITILNPNFPTIPITVRQLLQHKSSLHDSESDLQLWDEIGDPIYDLPTFCASYFIANGDLYQASNWGNTAPDSSSYWYSNAGYTLLGYIVQEASGIPFNEYCHQFILAPLEMNTAGWFYADVDPSDVAMPYNNSLQPFGYYSVPEYPAAMLKANVKELSNFLIAYTQGGIFENIQLFNSSTFGTIVPEDMTNGFGWWGTDTWWGDPSGNFWSHGGFMNGVRTQLNYYPTDSSGLIILTNGEGDYFSIQKKLEDYIPLFEIENPTAIQILETNDLTIYPNPTRDSFIIKRDKHFEQKVQVQIINSAEKLIDTFIFSNTTIKIDISKYPEGVYFLNIISGKRTWNKKIIIHK